MFLNETVYSYTDEKLGKISLMYKEILKGSGAKSYMRKGFLIQYTGYEVTTLV
jgi:hypothetical protein